MHLSLLAFNAKPRRQKNPPEIVATSEGLSFDYLRFAATSKKQSTDSSEHY